MYGKGPHSWRGARKVGVALRRFVTRCAAGGEARREAGSGARGPERVLEHRDFDVFRTRPDTTHQDTFTATFVPDGSGGIASVELFGVSFERME